MARAGKKRTVKIAIAAASVGVATSVVGVAATQPASISASLVDLTALIVVGSSTNPSGAGVAEFFGGKFNDPIYTGDDPKNPDIVYVDFSEGEAGIRAALLDNADDERNAILASGWGAANASYLLLRNDPALRDNTTLILDNDVARPDGGFGTRYPLFALIGVNPFPTPSEAPAGVKVVNTGYEYDYNSNAPAYVLNPFSAVNALAAYLTTRLNQADIDLPVDAQGNPIDPNGDPLECDGANTCAITANDAVLPCPDARCVAPVGDRITAYVTTRNDTTYVTYTTRELPLTTVIRSIFGDYIADVTAPLLKLAVDSGYYGGNPIPTDPSAYRPGRLFPSIGDILTMLVKLPAALMETLDAIVSPFQPQTISVARQLESPDEIADIANEVTSTGSRIGLTNITSDSLDALPGSGDITGAGTTGTGSIEPTDGLGTGQPTGPTQTDLTGTGTAPGTDTGAGPGTGSGTGPGTGTETGATGEHNGDNTNEDENTDENENENEDDDNSDPETGTGTGAGTGPGTGTSTSTGAGTGPGTGTGAAPGTGTGTGTGAGATNNDNDKSNDTAATS